MSSKQLLRSFAGGEITPELAGRLDLVKYQTGLAQAQNFITLPHGPATRRPGFEYINTARDVEHKVRLIPFVFSTEQTAVLEFGHHYIRVFVGGGALLEPEKTISSISAHEVYCTAHGYSVDDWVYISPRFYRVTATTTDSFTAYELHGGWSPAGTAVSRVFTIESPYSEDDLFDLHYSQYADVITLTHPKHPATELARQNEFQWTLTPISFAPPDNAPTGVVATPTIASEETDKNKTQAKYVVTAVADDGVTESLPSAPAGAVNNLTLAGNFNTVTWDPVSGFSRYNVYKLRGGVYGYIGQVTPTSSSPIDIVSARPIVDIGFFKYARVRIETTSAHGYSTGDNVVIDGTGYFDGVYQIEVQDSTVFTYAKVTVFAVEVNEGTASTPALSLVDDNVQADTTQSPPDDIVSLNKGDGDYPAATVYHEQRRWFAGTEAKPQAIWATRTGTDSNLTSSIPSRDADAMELRVASSQYNQIRHLMALSDLIALTAGGEFRIFADGAPAITPTSISIKPQGYSGASNVQPVVTTGSIVYVQAQGSRVRELSYSWEANAYKTTDASIMAPHRFNSHTIVDMAYSRAPDSIVWAVRDDGVLMAMTYVPDQQVYGWHAHDTDGKFESVCVVAEGNEDVLYAVVRRTVEGVEQRYIERMHTRFFGRQEFAFYVDSGLTYRGEDLGEMTINERTVRFERGLLQAKIVDEDFRAAATVRHTRAVGTDTWVFSSRQALLENGLPEARAYAFISIFDSSDSLQRRIKIRDTLADEPAMLGRLYYAPFSMLSMGAYSLLETATDFWYFGLDRNEDGCAIRISKADPEVQTKFAIAVKPSYAYPAYDNSGMWIKTSEVPRTFQFWSIATQSFVGSPRTGPTFTPTLAKEWYVGMYCATHLANGSLAYLDSVIDEFAVVVFLKPDGTYQTVELPTAAVPVCIRQTNDPNYVWVLTNSTMVKINVNTLEVQSTAVPGVARFNGSRYEDDVYYEVYGGFAYSMAYSESRKTFYWIREGWHEPGATSYWPTLVTFDIENFELVSEDVYPYYHASDSEYSLALYEFSVVHDKLWSGGYMYVQPPGNEYPWVADPVVAVIDLAALDGKYYVTYTDVGTIQFRIVAAISPSVFLVDTSEGVPVGSYRYYQKVDWVSGLWHLEGKTVQILADGAVHPERVVEYGYVDLDYPASVVTVGLKYTSDLKTLPLSIEGAAGLGQGTMKNVNRVHLRVSDSSTVKMGPSVDRLRDHPVRNVTDLYGAPPSLQSGEVSLAVDPSWNTDASVCVRQEDPLPLNVVSMTLDVQTGG